MDRRGHRSPPAAAGFGQRRRGHQAIGSITWTAAAGTRIGPRQFATFEVLLGNLPRTADRLVIPATQTYDDGKVVRWANPPGPGDHPYRRHPRTDPGHGGTHPRDRRHVVVGRRSRGRHGRPRPSRRHPAPAASRSLCRWWPCDPVHRRCAVPGRRGGGEPGGLRGHRGRCVLEPAQGQTRPHRRGRHRGGGELLGA
nr:DUF1775 domain-containing protein [Actinokineospora globicatena]